MAERNVHRNILAVAAVLAAATVTQGQLTSQQAERIEAAIPREARVAPKKPRRVLIWNTPFMDKCPHKGYCVPQAEHAMKLLGAGYWGHPWNEEVGIKLDEPDHPLLAAFGGKDFRLAEEIFQFREPYSRRKLRVLLSLDTKTTNMAVPWIHRTDNDFGLAWVKQHGKGRVFYCAIGHRTEIWWNPKILQFYLDGIQFAAGDLSVDTTPSAKLGVEPGFTSLFNGRVPTCSFSLRTYGSAATKMQRSKIKNQNAAFQAF